MSWSLVTKQREWKETNYYVQEHICPFSLVTFSLFYLLVSKAGIFSFLVCLQIRTVSNIVIQTIEFFHNSRLITRIE